MRRWAYMLGGLIVWAIHFLGVYVIASVGDVVNRASDVEWRMAALAFTGVCALIALGLMIEAIRRGPRRPADEGSLAVFEPQVAAWGAGIALVSILWQGLPTLIGY